jgi:hypothetical protein
LKIEKRQFQIARSVALLAILLFSQPTSLHAQPAAANYVLSLGGTNGFLE